MRRSILLGFGQVDEVEGYVWSVTVTEVLHRKIGYDLAGALESHCPINVREDDRVTRCQSLSQFDFSRDFGQLDRRVVQV